jgi:hypothetical protein
MTTRAFIRNPPPRSMNRDMSMPMRYGVASAKTILQNRGESKPSRNGLCRPGSGKPRSCPSLFPEALHFSWQFAAPLIAVSSLIFGASGCSASGATIAPGANGLKNAKPPSVLAPTDGAAPAVDMTCDTSACTVSWMNDIFPNMKSTGPWQCANAQNCHGATQAPHITDDDPSTSYSNLVNYVVMGTSKRYVQPCTPGNLSESGILCNLASPATCGAAMPINGGMILSPDQLQKITDWVKCGAPNN